MARFRLSRLAEADLAGILAVSATRWGGEGRRRYAAILLAALRQVAADPLGPATRDRADVVRGVRGLHLRHVRGIGAEAKVRRPGHVLYYRALAPGLIEIVRVLHERMEPARHLGASAEEN